MQCNPMLSDAIQCNPMQSNAMQCNVWMYVRMGVCMYMYIIIPTDTACCPDINNEDDVLSYKIGEITENTAYTLVLDSKV